MKQSKNDSAYHWHPRERVEVSLDQGLHRGRRVAGCRLRDGSSVVTENGRVDATNEASSSEVGIRTNPIISNRLVRVHL